MGKQTCDITIEKWSKCCSNLENFGLNNWFHAIVMNFVSTRFLRLKILSSRCKYTPTKEFHISACGLKDNGFTERYKPCEKVNATGKSLSKALLFPEHGGEHVV